MSQVKGTTTNKMDKKFYRRIIQYATLIAGGDALPWAGLYTARSVYNLLKNSKPLYPEDIGTQLGYLSGEYVNQIILALQNGGIEIKSVPTETINGRRRVKYTIETLKMYYVLVSEQGFEVRQSSKKLDLQLSERLIGAEGEDVEMIEN